MSRNATKELSGFKDKRESEHNVLVTASEAPKGEHAGHDRSLPKQRRTSRDCILSTSKQHEEITYDSTGEGSQVTQTETRNVGINSSAEASIRVELQRRTKRAC